MIDRTFPHTLNQELLQGLPQFIRDIGQIASLPLLAERILSGLCQATHQVNGSLYLGDYDHRYFRRVAVHGPGFVESTPHTISSNHPLIRQLSMHQNIFPTSTHTSDLHIPTDHTQPSEAEFQRSNIAVPLISKSRMVAFVLLPTQQTAALLNLENTEILSAMVQAAATALDSVLSQAEEPHLETLVCRTDRLRTLELVIDGYAHAIRNPLTSIKTFIQLACERRGDAEFINNFSRMALDDVCRLEHITQETLDYARYVKPQLTNEDLNEIVSSCLSLLELRTECRLIKIEKDLAPELPRGMLDRQHMQHALLNLLFNALDTLRRDGGGLRVLTSTSTTPNGEIWSHIDIEETGQGHPTSNPKHIDHPDVIILDQNEGTEKTGVGVTIAQYIVRAHRGNIHTKRTEGVGTICRINLPLLAA